MAGRRVNPRLVKLHRSYSVAELATCLGVHKNTVRHWQREGLAPIERARPLLFQGRAVREWLTKRNASRKRPCPAGTIYCFRCREPRPPALGLVEYVPMNSTSGSVRAICATCETVMHRGGRFASLAAILPGCDIQMAEAPTRLKGCYSPPLNCDLERQTIK
jgi:hypothetical protein